MKHEEIVVIFADENSERANGEEWHSDVSCLAAPPQGSPGDGEGTSVLSRLDPRGGSRPVRDVPVPEGQSKRRRIALPCAGNPSWSASETMLGAMRRKADSLARAMAVRFRNAFTVIPDDTWANPLVGSEAGHPMTKFAALKGVS